MKLKSLSVITVVVLAAALTASDASARIGSGRSSGSRGSRSYSVPGRTSPQPSPYRYNQQQSAPYQSPYQRQAPGGGGFLRSMAGGLLGGFLGGMLFRGLGFAGGGMGAGGGIGLFDILLLAGIAYLLYRFIAKRREATAGSYNTRGPATVYDYVPPTAPSSPVYEEPADHESGLRHIRQMDPGFSEDRFKEEAMDLFFRIQGAWMQREPAGLANLLTAEMAGIIGRDMADLKAAKRINRLENIAVRNTDIVEAWQESGSDFITVRFLANLLDYTIDESTGAVVEGSKTEPVKFEEFWTFTRSVGGGAWQLSAITQP